MNVASHLQKSARRYGDKTALIFRDKSYSFRQLERDATAIAHQLRARGIGKGDRIALFLPNCPEFITSYYAILKLGAIPVSIGSLLKKADVSHILQNSAAKIIITREDLRENVPQSGECEIVSTNEWQWRSDKSDSLAALDMAANDTAAILYTSATTGKSKGVMLTHGNIVSNVAETNRIVAASSEDRHLCCVPLYHVFGQNFIMNASIALGSTIVLEERFDQEQTPRTIREHRIDLFYGVPTMYEFLVGHPHLKRDLANIKYWFCAAAILKGETERKFSKWMNCVIYQGYGLTECSPCATYNHWQRHKFNSVGQPIHLVEVKIVAVDDLDQQLSPGELGEILIRGPNVMKGYFGDEDATRQTILPGGWLRSGDVGHLDEDGYLYIDDRVKDVIIPPGGFNVYPKKVEDVLLQVPDIQEVAVVGSIDGRGNEQVCAHIVARPGATVDEQQLIAFCRERMAKYEIPKSFTFADSIPKSPVGKVLKRILRKG